MFETDGKSPEKLAADARIREAMRRSRLWHDRLEAIAVIGIFSTIAVAIGWDARQVMIPHTMPTAQVTPLGRPSGSPTTTKTKHKTTPKSSTPKVQTVGKAVRGVPDFWVNPTGNIFRDINLINNRYIAWGDHQIAHDVPGIAATGPNAGTLTPQVMNSPAILKKYPGPKVPVSLKAAGVKLPANTPKNGAVTGLSLPLMQAALKANPWLHVTPQQLMGAYTVAAKWAMATNGNSGLSALRYFYPYLAGNDTQAQVALEARTWPTENGQLASRQVAYQSSVAYHLRPGLTYGAYDFGRASATAKQLGNVIANAAIFNVSDSIVGTGMVGGRLEIGNFQVRYKAIYMSLVRSGTQEHWYVAGAQINGSVNTPSRVYWTQGG